MVNKIFKEQIGQNVKVYVNDMIAKSKTVAYHAKNLEETLETIRANRMSLKLKKCAYEVSRYKCLSLMNERGI